MKVRAIKLGYHGIKRRRPGDVFDIKSEKEFSPNWMERVDGKAAKAKPKQEEVELEQEASTGDSDVI